MKIISFLLMLVCGFLVYDIYYGHNGISQYKKVEQQLNREQQKALALQKTNQEVADQINDLKQGSIAIEELARSELGLIKPNERFYRVIATDEQLHWARLNFN